MAEQKEKASEKIIHSRDAPKEKADKKKKVNYKSKAMAVTEESKNNGSRLLEKETELVQTRGDARKLKTGGSKKPKGKNRLRFAYEETAESVKTVEDSQKINQQDSDGVNFRKDQKKAQGKKKIYQEEVKKNTPKKHSMKDKVYQEGESPVKKKRLYFEENQETKGNPVLRKPMTMVSVAAHQQIAKSEDENAAVEGTHKLEESLEAGVKIRQTGVRSRKRRKATKNMRMQKKVVKEEVNRIYASRVATDEKLKNQNFLNKMIQKQRIKREYAKAVRTEKAMGTATVGTIDYIKKIGGKVTNFFVQHRKVYMGLGVLVGLMLLIMSSLSSCSAVFMQSIVSYAGTSYISTDEAIREADLYYTQLEADLQERINNMEADNPDYDAYRYNIGPIEHDPFILISYLSAKYEDFTFAQVKPELDRLFVLQYQLETEAVTETVTETTTVRVGESLGQVVTSGYCNCTICCGVWSGGPTASGAMPTSNHTIAVDANDPFVPMGTKVVMNGVEYTVEDTGAFARYGVQFDVYYDSHSAASAHGHKTWAAYLADSNGSREVEVTRTSEQDILNVTLNSGSLMAICQERLGIFQKELFSAYNETKGNLQMFESPFDFNWYGRVSSYFGYRIHPISGVNQMHNGLDIGVPEGTPIYAGLTGTVTESSYNDSYGNYVIIKDSDGYELRYAHLQTRSVSAGATIRKGDEIGKAGNTGNSIGSHLHIEVLKNGERLNPIFYLETGAGTIYGGNEYTSEAARSLLEEADRHLGTPYVWGGYRPGAFDCSGFVSYCLTYSGARNTGRLTAQGLYDICTPVSESDVQPGDLIFFTGTYNAGVPVTHVGIYAGNGQMIHCGKPVQYASIYSPYWQSHFYGFGRW